MGAEEVLEVEWDINMARPYLWETSESLEVLTQQEMEDLTEMISLM